ncbi:MAG: Serine hydroxymethyltransferase [Candidatus Shapirobacteria bacterium GW2011_GWE1_38_10]|uniref:Serine hydroxymethyltransferase n=1 Tax=Candidatus Shapirobacteria bacterium GW2011_GWE1_38_10 TaxID=1618488 RepID=A0A0G0I681_9BACT|nr:MAG: Serine hydroxymethyltransferase [Candidatus Shapirobacteria bacterium GW2011_GWF2_37_20]KKQ50828.1 MAG: Serine hydroxymethyltransferase [Candidatus Shapirobacteria bacterium GW2011_GWE1_38_10]KKQ64873.1 MAG: Serine hydroxymethyltransferase [Candidatus Shapirobacteria bacterium GW2011_GWF1_38_23]HBP51041.1 serine hydroxymethyltransferase [Candidatus Shapirobacteria bacterium]
MDKIMDLIAQEEKYQNETIRLIPSENFTSENVKKALASDLTNKYAEGYPGKRYYQGNKIVDEIENLAIERGKKLLGVEHLNVQAYSGSPANSAVLMALVEPGEKICGMKLNAGGHLTHGHPKITFSGKFFNSVQYDVDVEGRIDYEKLRELVVAEKPKLIFAGTTAYPWILDWEKFAKVADEVGAWLVADISHIAGLIVGGVHPSPVPYVHIVTSTTHKSLRGPRGAIIGVTKKGLDRDIDLAKKIDRAVFPGLQGGPHINSIAAMAVAFEEASGEDFKKYAEQIVKNAKVLADTLREGGLKVFGTENHLMVVDVGLERGKEVAVELEEAGIIVNANTIPHDMGSPFKPSGIRMGTPAMTTKGYVEADFVALGVKIADIVKR